MRASTFTIATVMLIHILRPHLTRRIDARGLCAHMCLTIHPAASRSSYLSFVGLTIARSPISNPWHPPPTRYDISIKSTNPNLQPRSPSPISIQIGRLMLVSSVLSCHACLAVLGTDEPGPCCVLAASQVLSHSVVLPGVLQRIFHCD